MKINMNIGITGHQVIGDSKTADWIYSEMVNIIVSQTEPIQGYSSLAKGADQLFCRVFIDLNLPYTAIIPSYKYETTFKNEVDIKAYYYYTEMASHVITLDYHEPSEIAFLDAGKLVVDQSDIMFAVWNGKPAQGLGGTADIVAYSIQKGKELYQFNNLIQRLIHCT